MRKLEIKNVRTVLGKLATAYWLVININWQGKHGEKKKTHKLQRSSENILLDEEEERNNSRRLRNKDEKTKLSFFAKFNRNKLFTRFLINNINIIYHVYFLNIVPFEPGTLYFVEGEWD